MANPPILRGNKITAAQFNELLAIYHTYWSDDNPDLTFAELVNDRTTVYKHNKGWGQEPVEPQVIPTEIIETTQTNRLINQINAGIYHIQRPGGELYTTYGFDLLSKYAKGSIVYYETYKEKIESAINWIELHRLAVDADGTTACIEEEFLGDEVEFTTELGAVYKATFSSYKEARYFFNSGGRLILDLYATGDIDWANILNSIGTFHIGAEGVYTTNGWSGICHGGIYDAGPIGDAALIYSFAAPNGGDYGCAYAGSYTNLGESEYLQGGNKIEIYTEAEELPSGEFIIYIIMRLVRGGETSINVTITTTVGCILPTDTPTDDLDTSIGSSFKTSTDDEEFVYQFKEREEPVITLDTSWN